MSETIYLGAGCYWCVEAVFQRVVGVQGIVSGFMGGAKANPTYKEVCSGNTGHAEVVELKFDPSQINLSEVLEIFFKLHDPTTPNRSGNDIGTQYRSFIGYTNPEQKVLAEAAVAAAQQRFSNPIVTQITEASQFYTADDQHQDYYRQNSNAGYCRYVVHPKLLKVKHAKYTPLGGPEAPRA